MSKTFVALFTYGGGMRGLIPAHLMAAIETTTGLGMADMVDVFTGPSTGSILNAALTRPHRRRPNEPQYKARHMIRFYEREGASIFPRDRFRELRGLLHDFNNRTMKLGALNNLVRQGHYNERNLARALYALYGDAKISHSLASLVIPCYSLGGHQLGTCNQLDAPGGSALWVRHMRAPAKDPSGRPPLDVTLYDAVMASCAAPTYFPCHDFSAYDPQDQRWHTIHGIDGNIFDNPCVTYQSIVKPAAPDGAQIVMVSLGTGITNRTIHKDEWNQYGALGVVDPANDLPLINIFFHATESAMQDAFGRELGDGLYDFNRSLLVPHGVDALPSIEIDDASPENMERMARFAQIILEDNRPAFDRLCHLLVSNRDRKQTEAKQGADFIKSIKRGIESLTKGFEAGRP